MKLDLAEKWFSLVASVVTVVGGMVGCALWLSEGRNQSTSGDSEALPGASKTPPRPPPWSRRAFLSCRRNIKVWRASATRLLPSIDRWAPGRKTVARAVSARYSPLGRCRVYRPAFWRCNSAAPYNIYRSIHRRWRWCCIRIIGWRSCVGADPVRRCLRCPTNGTIRSVACCKPTTRR